jgi:hypothetical protein
VILADDPAIYVKNVNYLKHKAEGKPVQIVGILRKERVTKAPEGAQGYGSSFDYYQIDAEQWSILEKVTYPWMREVTIDREDK